MLVLSSAPHLHEIMVFNYAELTDKLKDTLDRGITQEMYAENVLLKEFLTNGLFSYKEGKILTEKRYEVPRQKCLPSSILMQ